MDIKFSLSNGKMENIDIILNQLNNRLTRLENSISKAHFELKAIANKIEKTGKSSSGLSILEAQSLSNQLNIVLEKHRKNIEGMKRVVLNKKSELEEGVVSFLNQKFDGKELVFEIEKTQKEINKNYSASDEKFKNTILVKKISHQLISSESKKLKEYIIQVNNESIHMNTLLTDVRASTVQMIKEYNQARLEALGHASLQSVKSSTSQLLSDQIASFKPLQDEVSIVLEKNDAIQSKPRLCSCGGRGRTAFC